MDADSILYGSPKEKLLERATPMTPKNKSQLKAMRYLAMAYPDRYTLLIDSSGYYLREYIGSRFDEHIGKSEPIYTTVDSFYFSSSNADNCLGRAQPAKQALRIPSGHGC